MAATSRFSFGDVVLVPFPFTDQSGTRSARPSSSQARVTTPIGALPNTQQKFVIQVSETMLAQQGR